MLHELIFIFVARVSVGCNEETIRSPGIDSNRIEPNRAEPSGRTKPNRTEQDRTEPDRTEPNAATYNDVHPAPILSAPSLPLTAPNQRGVTLFRMNARRLPIGSTRTQRTCGACHKMYRFVSYRRPERR